MDECLSVPVFILVYHESKDFGRFVLFAKRFVQPPLTWGPYDWRSRTTAKNESIQMQKLQRPNTMVTRKQSDIKFPLGVLDGHLGKSVTVMGQ